MGDKKKSVNKSPLGIIVTGVVVLAILVVVIFFVFKGGVSTTEDEDNSSSLNGTEINSTIPESNTSNTSGTTGGDTTGGLPSGTSGDNTGTGDNNTGGSTTDFFHSEQCTLKPEYEYRSYVADSAVGNVSDFYECQYMAVDYCLDFEDKIAGAGDLLWDSSSSCCYWKCGESYSCFDGDEGEGNDAVYMKEDCSDSLVDTRDYCYDSDNLVEYACFGAGDDYDFCASGDYINCKDFTGDDQSLCYDGRCLTSYFFFNPVALYVVHYDSLDQGDDAPLVVEGSFEDWTYQGGADNDLAGDYTYTKLKIVIGSDIYEIPLGEEQTVNLDMIMKNYDDQTLLISFYTLVEGDLWEMSDSYYGKVNFY